MPNSCVYLVFLTNRLMLPRIRSRAFGVRGEICLIVDSCHGRRTTPDPGSYSSLVRVLVKAYA
jgi:hypothetical protein